MTITLLPCCSALRSTGCSETEKIAASGMCGGKTHLREPKSSAPHLSSQRLRH